MATIKLTGFNGATGRSEVQGDTDTVQLDGSVSLGNSGLDNIVFTGEIDSHFIPDNHNVFDIGSQAKSWATGHFAEVYAYKGLHVEGDTDTQHIIPLNDDQYSLGDPNSNVWKSVYATTGNFESVNINQGVLTVYSRGSDPAVVEGAAHLYSKVVNNRSEMFVRDAAGNVTQISPHNANDEWEYYSVNTNTGRVVKINMERMIRRLEEITGESFMEEYYE